MLVVWTPGDTRQYHHDLRGNLNLRSLFGPRWNKALWVRILCVEGSAWDEFAGQPNAPQAAPPMNSTQPYTDFAEDVSMQDDMEVAETPDGSLGSVPDQQNF